TLIDEREIGDLAADLRPELLHIGKLCASLLHCCRSRQMKQDGHHEEGRRNPVGPFHVTLASFSKIERCGEISSDAHYSARATRAPERRAAARRIPMPITFIAMIVIVIFVANVATLSTLMIGKTESAT